MAGEGTRRLDRELGREELTLLIGLVQQRIQNLTGIAVIDQTAKGQRETWWQLLEKLKRMKR